MSNSNSGTPPPPALQGEDPWAEYEPWQHRRVLLLVAVQRAMLAKPPAGVPAAAVVGPNITRILEAARNAPHPPLIIHVRNNGDVGEPDEPGVDGWQLVHEPLPHEPVLDKLKNNAFANTRLGTYICPEAEIVMVGTQSDFCIRATCNAAIQRGNEVLILRGAHATYDRLEVWNGGTITPASKVEKEVEVQLEEAGAILLDMNDLPDLFADR
ncbi:uncharacterized protein PHACADRAFT_251741 [Phanerochaete carnosa HHB-10118-sp]|uniref:Isochorismatase-like domain-containing protein n=1 Tax=Phanerochaete carnosa (strain HHB-10118-sp) TaxID=650164 RepID=K5WF17_PHACS|nr:uncharacterized protein PHACADRAFT_251741 [Phanerochaete carnosa HHB-10118-sp]EKM57855.1 hypothetical protein PHACADRAFT_251741 [Phanerochaete carnosa HHB-10118-sp]